MIDTTEMQDITATAAPDVRSPVLPGFGDAELKVRDVMTDHVVCAASGETVLTAIKKMSDNRVSCVVVVDNDTVVGILTERDVLRGVAAETGRHSPRSKVAERMSSPVISIAPDVPVLDASELIRSKGIKRLVVGDGKRLVGLVTQTDITRGLISLWLSENVADIMSTNVATVNVSVTVAEAARIMTTRNISCIVVMNHDEPVGIMTEKDVLKRVVALHRNPNTTAVQDVMSRPVVTSPPDHSILCVSRTMDRMRIHRLVVKENKHVCGIVSQTDILDALRRELERIREVQSHRRLEATQLAKATASNLSSIESLVRGGTAALTTAREAVPCGSFEAIRREFYPSTTPKSMPTSLQDLILQSRTYVERIAEMLGTGLL